MSEEANRIAEKFNNLDPAFRNLFGMAYVSAENRYWIPEINPRILTKLADARQYLKAEKGFRARKLDSEALSPADQILTRVRQTHSVCNFVSESAWLETGEQHIEGYESFLVGVGTEKVAPVDIPSPTIDALCRQLLPSHDEFGIFLSMIGNAAKGRYEVRPMVSPLLVLVSERLGGRNFLQELIGGILGGSTFVSSHLQMMECAKSIHRVVGETAFSSSKGKLNYHELRGLLFRKRMCLQGREVDFEIPEFVFASAGINWFPGCLNGLPVSASEKFESKDLVVLRCSEIVRFGDFPETELPGFIYRLLARQKEAVSGYFSPEVLQWKFRSAPEFIIYRYLRGLYDGKKVTRTDNELTLDFDTGPKNVSRFIGVSTPTLILRTLAKYVPDQIQYLGGDNWELNFEGVQ